jgi:hypothetical protein
MEKNDRNLDVLVTQALNAQTFSKEDKETLIARAKSEDRSLSSLLRIILSKAAKDMREGRT